MTYAEMSLITLYQNKVTDYNVRELLHLLLLDHLEKIDLDTDIYYVVLYLWQIKRGEYKCNGGNKLVIRKELKDLGEINIEPEIDSSKYAVKLTWEDVHYIRENRSKHTIKELTEMFKIERSTIHLILQNKRWKE